MVLTDKQIQFQKKMRQFAEKEIQPKAAEIDRTREFPWDNIKKMAKEGLFGIAVPKKLGGLELGPVYYAIAIEEISRVCASTGVTLAAHASLPCGLLLYAGSEEQKKKYLIPMVKGEKLGGFGLTEPGSGSDAAAMGMHAEKKNKKWVLNGTKMFTTNGSTADYLLVSAVTDAEKGTHGISAFIVEKEAPGFTVSKKLEKMGWRGSDTCELIFENCEVPEENILGKEGNGFKYFLNALDSGRIGVGAMAVGLAQGALDECLKWLKKEKLKPDPALDDETEEALLYAGQWNGRRLEQQGVLFALADMESGITLARNMVYTAAELKEQGKPFKKEAAIAKLFATEMGMCACTRAIDLLAPLSGTEDIPLSRFFRDVKACEIGEGTSQIQRIVISRELLKEKINPAAS